MTEPMQPGGDGVQPKEGFSADNDVDIPKTRRRRRTKGRRRKNTLNDGGEADDEDEYGPQIILEHMSSRTSIAQQSESGLSGFSAGIDFSSDPNSDEQELFTISKVVDPDVMADAYVNRKELREKALKPPRKKQRPRQRFVSQPELHRAGYIGSASRGGQYSSRLRVRSEGRLHSLAHEIPESTVFSDDDIENVNIQRRWYPSVRDWLRCSYPVDRRRWAKAMSEPPGETPFASRSQRSEHDKALQKRRRTQSFDYITGGQDPTSSSYNDLNASVGERSCGDGFIPEYGIQGDEYGNPTGGQGHGISDNSKDRDDITGGQRHRLPVNNLGDAEFSASNEGLYLDGDMSWDRGEVFMDQPQDVLEEQCSSHEPKKARENQRLPSVPKIIIQEALPKDWSLPGGITSPSVSFKKEFNPVNTLRIPGYAKRIVPDSTKATMRSFADELSRREDLQYTRMARRAGVVSPLTLSNIHVHNQRRRSEDDSCYYSIDVASQSQLTHIQRARSTSQYPECSSSDGIPRTSVSIPSHSSHSRPTFEDDAGCPNDACTVESCHTQGELELTVAQTQDEESQQRMPSGQRVYVKLVKCVAFVVIFVIVLICVLTLTSRDDY